MLINKMHKFNISYISGLFSNYSGKTQLVSPFIAKFDQVDINSVRFRKQSTSAGFLPILKNHVS